MKTGIVVSRIATDEAGDEQRDNETARLARVMPIERGEARRRRRLRRQGRRFEQAFEEPENAHFLGAVEALVATLKWAPLVRTQPYHTAAGATEEDRAPGIGRYDFYIRPDPVAGWLTIDRVGRDP